ncbi:hypothetical protein C0J52_01395 [Blattella germanica]|nr:hypothetical protein C0J52_01395 [Blattella germanica]
MREVSVIEDLQISNELPFISSLKTIFFLNDENILFIRIMQKALHLSRREVFHLCNAISYKSVNLKNFDTENIFYIMVIWNLWKRKKGLKDILGTYDKNTKVRVCNIEGRLCLKKLLKYVEMVQVSVSCMLGRISGINFFDKKRNIHVLHKDPAMSPSRKSTYKDFLTLGCIHDCFGPRFST